MCVF
jgi:chromosome segregation ATPase